MYVGGRFSRVCASDLEVEIERESARASSRMCAREILVLNGNSIPRAPRSLLSPCSVLRECASEESIYVHF
jgi:hypothetical protein